MDEVLDERNRCEILEYPIDELLFKALRVLIGKVRSLDDRKYTTVSTGGTNTPSPIFQSLEVSPAGSLPYEDAKEEPITPYTIS